MGCCLYYRAYPTPPPTPSLALREGGLPRGINFFFFFKRAGHLIRQQHYSPVCLIAGTSGGGATTPSQALSPPHAASLVNAFLPACRHPLISSISLGIYALPHCRGRLSCMATPPYTMSDATGRVCWCNFFFCSIRLKLCERALPALHLLSMILLPDHLAAKQHAWRDNIRACPVGKQTSLAAPPAHAVDQRGGTMSGQQRCALHSRAHYPPATRRVVLAFPACVCGLQEELLWTGLKSFSPSASPLPSSTTTQQLLDMGLFVQRTSPTPPYRPLSLCV